MPNPLICDKCGGQMHGPYREGTGTLTNPVYIIYRCEECGEKVYTN